MDAFVNIGLYIPLLPAILAATKWHTLNKPQRLFTILLWLIIVISFSGELWVHTVGKTNLAFYHVYILVEYLLLLTIFKALLNHSMNDNVWKVLAVGFTVIWIGNFSINRGWSTLPDYIHALEAVIILSLVAFWFIKMLKEKITLNPEKTFEFWMCSGLLLFFSGNFLLFLFSEFLMTIEMAAYEAIWKVHITLNIILYIMYSIAILWIKKTTK